MRPALSFLRSAVRPAIVGAVALAAATLARATTVVPPSFDELVNQSDYIVQAVVKSVTAESRRSPSGDDMIYSRVELEVKQVIAGKPPTPVVLQVLGGKLGERELFIEGAPKFVVGQESVFFVQGNGTQIYPLVRMMHGVYHVQKDAAQHEYLTRSNGEPLRSVAEVSGPLGHASTGTVSATSAAGAISPSAFVQQIRSTVRKPQLLEH